MKLQYGKDIYGCDILEDENKIHQVMMEWEKPYMKKSIELFNPFGRVLEIGFGLGYSATKICEMENITEYNVIECSPVVWEKFNEWRDNHLKKRPTLKINLIKGRWQDVLCEEGIFDSIYFDDYNGDGNIHEMYSRYNNFIYIILENHTRIGSKICSYSTINKNIFININCLSFECHKYDIQIPNYCNYTKGDKMYVPIYTVITEPDFNLKEKILGNIIRTDKKITEQMKKVHEYLEKPKPIYCNLMVIDNFYTNVLETRNYILTQEFKNSENQLNKHTISYATEGLKNIIQQYIEHFAGKITDWSMPCKIDGQNNTNISNGIYQYNTSRDKSFISTDEDNNWMGILYLTPDAPVNSGIGIYSCKDGTKNIEEAEARGNKEILQEINEDYTKWDMVDKIGNVFNRLVLFNSKQYYANINNFGTTKENGCLYQVFSFSTER
jgi:hypothetical protein